MSKKTAETVLLDEDNPGDARLLREMLNESAARIRLVTVPSMAGAEAHLAAHTADVILLDLGLADAQGLEAVRRAHKAAPRTPLVVLTGLDDETMAVQTLQVGAQDYLVKGQIESAALLRAIRYAIERKTAEENLFAEKERAQVTLDCIGDAVICTDIAGNITFLNVLAEKFSGWSRGEAIGRPMSEVFCVLGAGKPPVDAGLHANRDRAPWPDARAARLRSYPARR
jgi:PleD family two-component response regulator